MKEYCFTNTPFKMFSVDIAIAIRASPHLLTNSHLL
jgi:hypothetical protein